MLQPLPDLPTLAAALQKAFPGLPGITPLSVLGEGFSSLAVETPGGAVFRIPRTPEAGARYAREFRLLPLLKPHLPLAIPEPRWYLPAAELFPYGVIGYPMLPGRPLDFADLLDPARQGSYAAQMAAILLSLHQTPAGPFHLEDNGPQLRRTWQSQHSVVMPALKEVLADDEYRRVADWWQEFLANESLRNYSPLLVHGDFWFGNLLVEAGRITGLVDFENTALGDPALDFVPLLYLGEGFYRRVLDAYQSRAGCVVDAGFEQRLRQLWSAREFDGIDYAVRYQDRAEFEESLVKLRRGPILSSAGLDGWGKIGEPSTNGENE